MSRKQSDVQQMDDEVIKCYINANTGKEETTPTQRREIAEHWCAGDYTYHLTTAYQHGLLPVALLIAALIDIDHPLLVSGRGVVYNSVQSALLIIQVMLAKNSVAQPIRTTIQAEQSFHSEPV